MKTALLLSLCGTAHAGMVLLSMDAPPCDNCDAQTDSLRGVKPGDIWGPPIKGSNRLACGTEVIGEADPYKGEPLSIPAGSEFGVRFGISRPDQALTGTMRVQMKYGETVSFAWDDGWDIENSSGDVNIELNMQGLKACNDNDDTLCGADVWSLPAKGEGGYTGPAVLQVEFRPDVSALTEEEEEGSLVYYQCIDLAVTNGDELPEVGPWGLGDPTKETTSKVRSKSLVLTKEEPALSTLAIILIVLACLLVFFICCYCFNEKRKKDDGAGKLEPQRALEEHIVEEAAAEPSKEQTPTPPVVADSETTDPEPPTELQRDLESGVEQKVEAGDGSSGRYFHFTYVDEDQK